MDQDFHGGHLFKNRHYWFPEDREQLTSVNGRLVAFTGTSYNPNFKYGFKLQVGLMLIERHDGPVRFVHMYSADRVFKDGDPEEKEK